MKPSFHLEILPPPVNLETVPILKKLGMAHRYLAELKGISGTIPNQAILINSLSLQEAKDSSAIENIITTHDELFQEELFADITSNPEAKEVRRYAIALKKGFELVQKSKLLTNQHILEIQDTLGASRAGFRKLPGTELKNLETGRTVYVPPQNHDDIVRLMTNLERFINDDALLAIDPIIKMAVIHYQFESIHPFYDGNGRTGRIINILYLVQKELLNIPVLYLSRYIIQNKNKYYQYLQNVRDKGDWESWILYMLEGIEQTARQTIAIVQGIGKAMLDYKHRIRDNYKFYSQDLLNNLFSHPYTKIDFLRRDLRVSRLTATKYLDILAKDGFLRKKKMGRSNYYINTVLFNLLTKTPKT
ncbi:MAG: Fic family protein [Candidatus Omnitrophica bacterium]|nr:Fic family protein [Candidatus Omnitrophota bacterium]